jgi:hypothetical protein
MEEEDFPYPTPFFLQTANISNPKRLKQPKPQISKCNYNPSSSITQQILCLLPSWRFYNGAKNNEFKIKSSWITFFALNYLTWNYLSAKKVPVLKN